MLHVMRLVQKVSHIVFAHKIRLQVSGTKYPVISTSYQVSDTTKSKGQSPQNYTEAFIGENF